MSTKAKLNHALSRLTGHHLTKGEPGELVEQANKLRRELREARAQAARQQRGPAAAKAAAPSQAKQTKVKKTKTSAETKLAAPHNFDDGISEIVAAVQPWTMVGSERLHALITSVRYVVRHDIPGDIVECGVWRGGSMQAVARTLLGCGVQSRDLYLFDTFEGMPPPTDKDVRGDGHDAAKLMETNDRDAMIWAYATLQDVRAGFEQVPYPTERVHYVQGKVEDTIPDQLPERISLLRLDTDWYESTDHELRHAYERLSPGGVMMIDDYDTWAGARQATDEFLDRTGERLLLVRTGIGRIAVKPSV